MILVVGSINVDFVVQGPHLPRPGETVLGGRFFQAGGGKGANQALAARRAARRPVAFASAVGDDELGHAARARLLSEGLLGEYLYVLPETTTGVALIMVDAKGENAISVAAGANARLSPEHIESIPDAVWRECRVLLASLEVPRATVECALRRARKFGLTTILNPAPADPAWARPDLLSLVDILTPNESEALQLAEGHSSTTWHDPRTAAAHLASLAASTVLLTQGAAGVSRFGGSGEPRNFPARRVTAVDTTAAGDAFNGAFAAALAEGQTLDHALRFAIAAAGISVTRWGAQPSLPTRDEILAAMDEMD